MSESKAEDMSDLNVVAAIYFKHALAEDTQLLLEWKKVVAQLFETGIPQDLEALSKLVLRGDSNAETETS